MTPLKTAAQHNAAAGSTVGSYTFTPKLPQRRKHSRDGSVRCDICVPLRCSKARP